MRDVLDTLRNLRDVARDTVGMTARQLADFELRGIDDVLADLGKLRHDGLVAAERDPMGSEWWALTEDGERHLADVDAQRIAQPDEPGKLIEMRPKPPPPPDRIA